MSDDTPPPATNPNPYDQVPYLSTPYRSSHPDILASLAKLLGMEPPPVDQCRVLELGCSIGGNLLPMAYGLPNSQFVGLDRSAQQIEMGRETQKALDLTNVTLQQLDLLDLQDQFGQFDYIIAHGLYSWVPPDVQDKILDICQRLLTPRGLAYISYNTYPGWHMRGLVRDMMLYHTQQTPDLLEKAAASRALLSFLVDKVGSLEGLNLTATDTSAYLGVLRYEHNLLTHYQDWYIIHEHLEESNEPVYFSEFMRRAGGHGLQYVTEADFTSSQILNYPQPVAEKIRTFATDVVQIQQYLDFASNRTFRQTVLCRSEVALNRNAPPAALKPLYIAGPMRPVSGATPDLHSAKDESFAGLGSKTAVASVPLLKAALLILGEIWPSYIKFEALLAAAHERLTPGVPHVYTAEQSAAETQLLGATLLLCFAQGLVELHTIPTPYYTQISSQPTASPLARLQARNGAQVANLRHEVVTLDEILRKLIIFLDGAHDRAALFNLTAQMAADGTLVVQSAEGQPVTTEEARNALLAETLNQALLRLAASALLVN